MAKYIRNETTRMQGVITNKNNSKKKSERKQKQGPKQKQKNNGIEAPRDTKDSTTPLSLKLQMGERSNKNQSSFLSTCIPIVSSNTLLCLFKIHIQTNFLTMRMKL